MTDPLPLSYEEIREQALIVGFDDVGITSAEISQEDISAYLTWLENKFQGRLAYMENQLRCFPQHYFPGAKTAIIFVSYYKQERLPFKNGSGLIASYARGRDYHHVHRKRIKRFIKWLEERVQQTNIAKGFSDSSPVLEKALAVQAGLGWFGKNTLLIHRKFGTFTLLAGVFTTLDIVDYPKPTQNIRLPRCGQCTRCLDACPTQAFTSPYQLNATKCLSYQLIESKDPINEETRKANPGYAFGCDVCQDVCPHNYRTPISLSLEFSESQGMGSYLTSSKLAQIENNPEKLFGTPLQRRGVAGLKHSFESLPPLLEE